MSVSLQKRILEIEKLIDCRMIYKINTYANRMNTTSA